VRLETIVPRLAKSFQDASDDQRRRAALAACLVAVAQTGLLGSDVDAALSLLRDERNERIKVRHEWRGRTGREGSRRRHVVGFLEA
jgi:hypothetical protein